MNRQEKYDKLVEFIQSITGSLKNPVSGVFMNCMKGQINKNYGHPEFAVCLEDLQAFVADGGYCTKSSKTGKTWIPVRLQVWGKDAERKQVKEVEASSPATELYDELPDF